MPIRTDTTGTEKRYILDMLDVENRHILEIGCGDGRMTWQYANLAQNVTAIDVDIDELQSAISNRPADLKDTVTFSAGSAIRLPFKSGSFDHVIFAWSF